MEVGKVPIKYLMDIFMSVCQYIRNFVMTIDFTVLFPSEDPRLEKWEKRFKNSEENIIFLDDNPQGYQNTNDVILKPAWHPSDFKETS